MQAKKFHSEKYSSRYKGGIAAGAFLMTKTSKVRRKPTIQGWVRRAKSILDEKGWSIPRLAAEMDNLSQVDALYKIFQGKVENPRGQIVADIAAALGVTERNLRYCSIIGGDGGGPRLQHATNGVPEIDIRAGMGGGGTMEGREVRLDGEYADPVKEEPWQFPARFVREEIRASEKNLRVMETYGDSMSPTLLSGDRVIVDTGHKLPSPDGIYALRDQFGFIVVKRLQVMRTMPPTIRVISDNKSHDPEDVRVDDIAIVGRVLWAVKRL